jgi:hypothetical protein
MLFDHDDGLVVSEHSVDFVRQAVYKHFNVS